MTEQKEWSWRDSGQHKLPVRLLNTVSRLSGYARKRFDPDTFIDQAIKETGLDDFWLRGIEKMIAYDKNQLTGWCHHLHYRDLMTDPVAAMRGAYNHFGENISALHERRMTAWVEQRPMNTYGRHVYSLEDFGLDPGKLREQYAEYIETYKVAEEFKVK